MLRTHFWNSSNNLIRHFSLLSLRLWATCCHQAGGKEHTLWCTGDCNGTSGSLQCPSVSSGAWHGRWSCWMLSGSQGADKDTAFHPYGSLSESWDFLVWKKLSCNPQTRKEKEIIWQESTHRKLQQQKLSRRVKGFAQSSSLPQLDATPELRKAWLLSVGVAAWSEPYRP